MDGIFDTYVHTYIHTGRQAGRQAGTDRQTDKRANIHAYADRQTRTHTFTQFHLEKKFIKIRIRSLLI